jgi:hypothetical protein
MPGTTKRKLVDELVGWGYVALLVDSFATRGIEHACTGGFLDIAGTRRSDAYGALAFLARQTFVDSQRVAAVGFSQGGWVTLLLAEANSFELFVRPSNLIDNRGGITSDRREKLNVDVLDLIATKGFRAVVAFYPLYKAVAGRSAIPTLLLEPSTNGRQRQTAPRKLTPGALTGRRLNKSSTPASTTVSTILNSSPAEPYLVAGRNTTGRQPPMQAAGCDNFLSAT